MTIYVNFEDQVIIGEGELWEETESLPAWGAYVEDNWADHLTLDELELLDNETISFIEDLPEDREMEITDQLFENFLNEYFDTYEVNFETGRCSFDRPACF